MRWIEAYERAWRSPGTDQLAMVFAPEVTYRTSPWDEPVKGLDDLARLWEHERAGHDEGFVMHSDVVAVEGRTAVVRVSVDYEDPAVGDGVTCGCSSSPPAAAVPSSRSGPLPPGPDDAAVGGV